MLGLLLSFQLVVRGSVRQGEQRRRADAALAEAQWRCRMLDKRQARAQCLAALAAPPAPVPMRAALAQGDGDARRAAH